MSRKQDQAIIFIQIILLFIALSIPSASASDNLPSVIDSMTLDYAEQFSVDYLADGSKLFTLGDGQQFYLPAIDGQVPENLPKEITSLHRPIKNIYLAATAVMCLFDVLDELDSIRLSGTKESGWYIQGAKQAMQDGKIIYAGKYSEPDYELLLENECSLAIESQMINHTPEVKEKLEELGIPVLIDLSSSEHHPLGRTEWIRFYGALLDEEEKAEKLFKEQTAFFNDVRSSVSSGKTAAFFHISTSGLVVVRKSGDYVSKMIELAGGKYVFDSIGDHEKSTSTVTIDMETFFSGAKDADVIFYNSTIAGEVNSLSELLTKNPLLGEFKAVRDGNVWCTSQNMYQDTTHLGQMIQSFHRIFTEEAAALDELPYFVRLR
ncbi:MAG: ABC transporter substrate-binding protein [Anaerolineaceae bacterium]|nr:ABC transporter substrate-binding protein [Anaerolineaceae bacterium]